MDDRQKIWQGDFLTFWSDGTLSHDDGVGYLGETSLEDVKALYEAMKELFENPDKQWGVFQSKKNV